MGFISAAMMRLFGPPSPPVTLSQETAVLELLEGLERQGKLCVTAAFIRDHASEAFSEDHLEQVLLVLRGRSQVNQSTQTIDGALVPKYAITMAGRRALDERRDMQRAQAVH